MINPRRLELPLSQTNFHGPKGVRAIEVRLYIACTIHLAFYQYQNYCNLLHNKAIKYFPVNIKIH